MAASLALLLALLLPSPARPAAVQAPDATTGLSDAPPPPQEPVPPGGEATPAVRSTASPLDYQVGPGDILEINVFGNDDLSRISSVQTDGGIVLPLLGEVQVAGLTVAEVQRKVTNLLEKDYLVNPQVEVKVREYNSQFVSVVGEVNSPGRKPLRGRSRLIDMLVEAGGFTPRASGEVVITRGDGAFDSGEKTIRIRLSGGTPTVQDQINLELPLRHGDIITASPKFFVTVDGEVNRPGRYAIESNLTVTGAISLAGGRTRFGADDVKVRRVDPETGKTTLLSVDLDKVRDGKRPDPVLLPDDVISVPRRFF